MVVTTINFSEMGKDDLINCIRECQLELGKRGIVTRCKILPYPKYKKVEFISTIKEEKNE